MDKSRNKLIVNYIVQSLLIWMIFRSVISSSLLKYSNYASVLALINGFSLIVRLFIIIFAAYCYTSRKFKVQHLVVLFIYTLIVVISKGYNDSWQFFDALIIAFLFKDEISKKQVITLFFRTIIVSCTIVIFAYLVGLFPYYIVRRIDGRERMHLGFVHPNSLGYYVMICSFLYVLIVKEKIKYIHIAALVCAAYFTYVYPNSLSSAISIFLLALYLLVSKLYFNLFKKNIMKSYLFKSLSIMIIPLIFIFIFWMIVNSASSSDARDSLSTFYSRFRLGSNAIQEYGIHLFGTRDIMFVGTASMYFSDVGIRYFTVDCFYMQVLVRYGIIPSLFFFSYYTACIRASIKERDSDILIMLVIMSVYSISESMILTVPTSFLFIISSQYISKRKQESVVNKKSEICNYSLCYAEKRI